MICVKRDGQFQILLEPESLRCYAGVDLRPAQLVAQDMGMIVEDALLRVALISHPENYVVKRKPKLTSREERKIAAGDPIPVRKRPYYEVLDHAGLVRLRQGSTSTALDSPVPQARRGHWMRLAERCKAARSDGKSKVWRHDTYVGEREFEDASSRFEVFLSAAEAARASADQSRD